MTTVQAFFFHLNAKEINQLKINRLKNNLFSGTLVAITMAWRITEMGKTNGSSTFVPFAVKGRAAGQRQQSARRSGLCLHPAP
ncbi:hypothetical protein DLP95_04130 [Salmonella enterica]|nr:hypothetical protein [Salmonella enterica]EBL9513712.1 hypothetical protein [Salmonella enterica]MFJ30981.1 hypothetical protein [Salmonella enterica]